MDTDRDVNELAGRNPKVNKGQLAEALSVIRELREAGVTTKPGYSIIHPFSRRPVASQDAEAEADAVPAHRRGRR